MTGASMARSRCSLAKSNVLSEPEMHTLTARTSPIDTGTCNEHIVDNRENAFAAHPASISILNLTVIEHSRLVQLDRSAVYGLCESFVQSVERTGYALCGAYGISSGWKYSQHDFPTTSAGLYPRISSIDVET